MKCEEASHLTTLLLYGELGFDEEEELESHIGGCPACRTALERERVLHQALDRQELEPSPFLLRRARQRLAAAIEAGPERRPQSLWTRFVRWVEGPGFAARAFRPAGAVALVATGFFASQFVPPAWRTGFQSAGLVDPSTAHVRYVEPSDNGKVQIVLDETRQRVVSGRLDEEPIRKLLLTAAKDPSDPGLRVETVEILKSRSEEDDIRSALVNSLLHDSNSGVRLKALDALKPYAAQADVRKALGQALLHDDNPGVRTQAIDLLTHNKNEDQMVGVLQELMRKEQNTYVRDRCGRLLREAKASVDTY